MTKARLLGEIALSVPFPITLASICCPQQIIIPIHNIYRNTSSGPMSLPQSLLVWKKAGYLLPGPHKLCPAKCPQIVLSVGSSIINCMKTVLSYCEIHHLDIFHQKVGQNISTENIFHWQIASGQNVTGLMSEPSCRFSPFLGKHSWKKRESKLNFCTTCLHFVTKTVKIATTSCSHLNAWLRLFARLSSGRARRTSPGSAL